MTRRQSHESYITLGCGPLQRNRIVTKVTAEIHISMMFLRLSLEVAVETCVAASVYSLRSTIFFDLLHTLRVEARFQTYALH